MSPWSTPACWRPSRYRIDAAIWRWVIFPLITAAILTVAAYFATFAAARADDAFCPDSNVCFDLASIVYNTDTPGQMALPIKDTAAGTVGWIAVDCVAQLALTDTGIDPSDAAMAALCDTIGSAE